MEVLTLKRPWRIPDGEDEHWRTVKNHLKARRDCVRRAEQRAVITSATGEPLLENDIGRPNAAQIPSTDSQTHIHVHNHYEPSTKHTPMFMSNCLNNSH